MLNRKNYSQIRNVSYTLQKSVYQRNLGEILDFSYLFYLFSIFHLNFVIFVIFFFWGGGGYYPSNYQFHIYHCVKLDLNLKVLEMGPLRLVKVTFTRD